MFQAAGDHSSESTWRLLRLLTAQTSRHDNTNSRWHSKNTDIVSVKQTEEPHLFPGDVISDLKSLRQTLFWKKNFYLNQ